MELRQMIDVAPQHVAILAPDASALYVNQAALDYLGLTVDEWCNADRMSFFHPDDHERLGAEHQAKFLRGHPHQTETRLRRNDGKYRWFLFHISPLRDEHGLIKRWYVAATDIEDRKQAEEKLRQSEAYLAEAQRLSHTGSWAWTPATGKISYWSEECYLVLGFDPYVGLPRFETSLQRIHTDDQAGTTEKLERARREKVDFELDYRIVHPGGEIRDIYVVGHPVLSPSGDLVEFVGTVIDVTGRKRAEEERERLHQVQADLAHVSRITTMGELTASLAHEVNQPIAAAVTNANTCLRWLTRDQPELEEAREAAARIVKDGTRAAEIIKRIRLLFKKDPPERKLVEVNEVIRDTVALLGSDASRCSISVLTELAEDLPPCSRL